MKENKRILFKELEEYFKSNVGFVMFHEPIYYQDPLILIKRLKKLDANIFLIFSKTKNENSKFYSYFIELKIKTFSTGSDSSPFLLKKFSLELNSTFDTLKNEITKELSKSIKKLESL